MRSQRVGQHDPLADQKLACPIQHQNALLLLAFDRYKPHRDRGAGDGLAECLSIGSVVLLSLRISLRHQLYPMTQSDK